MREEIIGREETGGVMSGGGTKEDKDPWWQLNTLTIPTFFMVRFHQICAEFECAVHFAMCFGRFTAVNGVLMAAHVSSGDSVFACDDVNF